MEGLNPWPLVPKPYPDELFSSWVSRTALAHRVDVSELFSRYFSKDKFYLRELEMYPFPPETWRRLASVSGVPEGVLRSMQIRWAIGRLVGNLDPSSRMGWIIRYSGRSSHSLEKRKSGALRYCPLCLGEARYYRHEWKLLFVNVCRRHRNYLLDRCHECGSVVIPQRIEPPHHVETCFACHADLCRAPVKKAWKEDLLAVETCIGVLRQNGIRMGDDFATALEFFRVLRDVSRNLLRLFPEEEVFDGLKGVRKKGFKKRAYLEQCKPEDIAMIVTAATRLLTKNWPSSFIRFLRRNRLHYISNFKNRRELVKNSSFPGWFLKCFYPWPD